MIEHEQGRYPDLILLEDETILGYDRVPRTFPQPKRQGPHSGFPQPPEDNRTDDNY